MTYDPRVGASPYLGMDGTDADADESPLDEWEGAGRSDSRGRTRVGAQEVPKTVRRSPEAPRRGVAPQTGAPLVRRPQSQVPYAAPPIPSPQQQPYVRSAPVDDYPQPRGLGSRMGDAVLAFALFVIGLALRFAAIGLAAVFVVSAIPSEPTRAILLRLNTYVPLMVPSSLLGQFVYETPFGGILRGDLAIASIILFVADWLCARKRSSLRWRRERGE